MTAVKKATSDVLLSDIHNKFKFNIDDVALRTTDLPRNQNNSAPSFLFSFDGLESFRISHDFDWPLPAIFSKQVMIQISKATIRILKLFQLMNLCRMVWGDVKGMRKSHKYESQGQTKSSIVWIEQNAAEFYDIFRNIRMTVQSLLDFTSDRVRSVQDQLKLDIHQTLVEQRQGFAGLVNLYASFAIELIDSIFAVNESSAEDGQVSEAVRCQSVWFISNSFSDVLNSCLDCIGKLWACVQSVHYPIKFKKLKTSLRRDVARLANHQRDLLSALKIADNKSKNSADTLLLFLSF